MTPQNVLIAYLVAVVVVQAVFAAFPGIDLAVSSLFTSGDGGFDWTRGSAQSVNLVIRRIGETVSFLLLVGFLYGMVSGKLRGDGLRLLAYPLLCVALASGGLVNLLLKAHVGRARPDTLADFGGTAQFTPPWQVTSECARNCSFASGEVALAASLAIPILVILWPRLSRNRGRLVAVLAAAAYIAVTSLLRIGLGRHFLSDTVYSVLISAGTALLLYPALRIETARRNLSVLAPRKPASEQVEHRGVQ